MATRAQSQGQPQPGAGTDFTVGTEERTQALRQMGEPVRGGLSPSLQGLHEEETGSLRGKMGEDELD